MSATSGTRVMWHPNFTPWTAVVANGHPYVTDGIGRIENAAEADVAALESQGFSPTEPVVNADNTSEYGRG